MFPFDDVIMSAQVDICGGTSVNRFHSLMTTNDKCCWAFHCCCAQTRCWTNSQLDLRPNKRLNKHWWGWWFETPSCPLWRRCNDNRCLMWVNLLSYHTTVCIPMVGSGWYAEPTTVKSPMGSLHNGLVMWNSDYTWWRLQMEAFFALLVLCVGTPHATCGIPSQRPVTRSFDVFFDLRVNKRLSKQSRRRWFETPPSSLWRHCNVPWLLKPEFLASPGHQHPWCWSWVFISATEVYFNNLRHFTADEWCLLPTLINFNPSSDK